MKVTAISTPQVIDTKMHGKAGITGAFLVRGTEKTALVETGPRSVVDNVFTALDAAGIDDLDWIIVTHIHLDHAGAAGTLAERFPNARVAVHEVGAPHLVDPSKLWSSAARIYGDRMEQLWGGIDPIAEERIEILRDGDTVTLGGATLRAVETPGHAYHHHAYLYEEEGIVFCGDALGVRLPDVGVIRPATPPPEFHLEKAIASIERIRDLGATSLWPTHFGPHDEGKRAMGSDDFCSAAVSSLRRWAEWVEEARAEADDLDEATELVARQAGAALESELPADEVQRMENTTSYRMNTSGYLRYFDKASQARQVPS